MARTVSEVVSEPVVPYAIRWHSRVYSLIGLAGLLVVEVAEPLRGSALRRNPPAGSCTGLQRECRVVPPALRRGS